MRIRKTLKIVDVKLTLNFYSEHFMAYWKIVYCVPLFTFHFLPLPNVITPPNSIKIIQKITYILFVNKNKKCCKFDKKIYS